MLTGPKGGHELWASINQVGNALQQTKLARAGGSSGEASLLLTPPDKLLWLFFRC